MKNRYEYLAGSHDLLSLRDWGPYANDVYTLSHIADREKGVKFDFFLMPAILRRKCFLPEPLCECGCSPLEAAADLSIYTIRQQMEGMDQFYADLSYAEIEPDLWLGRCEFVNHTNEKRAASMFAFARVASQQELQPVLPAQARWLDALEYKDIKFAYERFDHHLTFGGGRRGERVFPGTVGNRCLGQPVTNKPLPCFGAKKGDQVAYEFQAEPTDGAIAVRIRLEKDQQAKFTLNINGPSMPLVFKGSGEFETVMLYRGKLSGKITMQLQAAEDSEGVWIDGFVIGNADMQTSELQFAPLCRAVNPQSQDGPFPDSALLSGSGLKNSYCYWWSRPASSRRDYWVGDIREVARYGYGLRQPYYRWFGPFPGDQYCHDSYIIPILIEPENHAVIYTLYCADLSAETAAKRLQTLDRSEANLEKLYQQARQRLLKFSDSPSAKAYELSQNITAATALTNVNFPVRTQGHNIRHHVPDKYYNSLYTWDSGFIGLGFLELDKVRAIENLNVYVTPPEDEENAFIFYGTPLPVQAYLYQEIWNRFQDHEMLEYFYNKLHHYYDFIAGHVPHSTFRAAKSNLLRSWDYFYNSGGWDDYPPQWYLFQQKLFDIAPAVTTAHAIRFAKILMNAATELGRPEDLAMLEEDIQTFADALQKYSWSEKDGIFSYVKHDKAGNADGIWLDPASGVNYNFGLDGISPLVSGICTDEQKERLYRRLNDPQGMWSKFGISSVDQSAPYFRNDGYWNGGIWMPHQWFIWKAALDDNRSDFAWKIANTALQTWHHEVRQSRYTFEHFSMETGCGAGCCHFGGLSSPVLNWYASYYMPGRFTGGLDTWIQAQKAEADQAEATLRIGGNSGNQTTLLFTASPGQWSAQYNGQVVPVRSRISDCIEITLPKATRGTLKLCRISK